MTANHSLILTDERLTMAATTRENPTTPPTTTNKQQSRRLKIILLLATLIGYEFIVENFGSNKDYSISSIATWTTISTTSTESSISTKKSTTTTTGSNRTINRYGNNGSPNVSNHGSIGSVGNNSDKYDILILNGTGNNDANTMSSRHYNKKSSHNTSSPSFSSSAVISNSSQAVSKKANTGENQNTDGNGSDDVSSTISTLPPIPNAIGGTINSATTVNSSRNNNNMSFPVLDHIDNQNASNTNSTPTAPLVTIFVQLKGELGNHLSVWIQAKGMQYYLQDHYGIQSQLKFLHQMTRKGHVNGKKKPTQYRIEHCFPKLWLELQSSGGSLSSTTYTELIEAEQEQKEFYDSISSSKATTSTTTKGDNLSITYTAEELSTLLNHVQNLNNGAMSYKPDTIPKGLHAFVQLMNYKRRLEQQEKQDHPTADTTSNPISVPYLLAETLSFSRYMMDTYREKMLDYFQFNYTNPICCGVSPYPNETVFVSLV